MAVDGAAAGDDLLLFDDLPSALAGHEALVAQLHKGRPRTTAPFRAAAARVLRLRAELAGALVAAAAEVPGACSRSASGWKTR